MRKKKTIQLYYNGSTYDTGIKGRLDIVIETAPYFSFIMETKPKRGDGVVFAYNSIKKSLDEIPDCELLGPFGIELKIEKGKIYLNNKSIENYIELK